MDGWMADGIGNEQWNNTLCIHLMAFETADKFELKALRIEGGPFEIGQVSSMSLKDVLIFCRVPTSFCLFIHIYRT